MRITVTAQVEGADGKAARSVTVAVIERCANFAPSSGLGLFLGESHELLRKLQAVVLQEETAEFVEAASRCGACKAQLATKDTKALVYRTVFGKARLDSPRLYCRCVECGMVACLGHTFSPLALALPERTHPQWTWLQSRYASVMSYRLAQIFLRDAFPAGGSLPTSSLKLNVRAIGERLERESEHAVAQLARELPASRKPVDARRTTIALQIDAGYVRAARRPDDARWIGAVASKVVGRQTKRTPAHAYATGFNPHQGLRQQAFLSSVGVSPDTPVTVISDGGEDISFACQLPAAAERVLDWFHIGMRFEHLLTAMTGMRGLLQQEKDILVRRAEGAKWLLWHRQHERCLQRLEGLRRDTGWVGPRNPLGRLILYLTGCTNWLINYAKRYAQGRPISSAGAESAVDYVIGQRMKRNGHMQWTRQGVNALLQVRCAVLNGQDIRNFKRWYPPDKRNDGLVPRAAAA